MNPPVSRSTTQAPGARPWTATVIAVLVALAVIAAGALIIIAFFAALGWSMALLVQETLRRDPHGGHLFVFRGRQGHLMKVLYWDGQGFCLYYKVLAKGRFPWPMRGNGAVRLTSAQLAMLWEGIDWRRPDWGAGPPEGAVVACGRCWVHVDAARPRPAAPGPARRKSPGGVV